MSVEGDGRRPNAAPVHALSAELVLHVVLFLPLDDLLAVRGMARMWHAAVGTCLTKVMGAEAHVRLLTFKARHGNADVPPHEVFIRAWSAQHKRALRTVTDTPSGLYLIGGTFNSRYSGGFAVEDPCGGPHLTPLPRAVLDSYNFADDLDMGGACAATLGSDGKIVLLGGWNEDAGEAGEGGSAACALKLRPLVRAWDEDSLEWEVDTADDLPRPVCFAAATTTVEGHLVLTGGCDVPYQGSDVYDACVVLRYAGDDSFQTQPWEPLPAMDVARCGHCCVTLYDGSVVALGGYGGGQKYMNSVERLDLAAGGRWVPLPEMRHGRSGGGAGLGPDGAVYCAGGSPDGTRGLKECERLDARCRRWEALPPMPHGHGYTAATWGRAGCFYVSAGLDVDPRHVHRAVPQPYVDCFDVRKGAWHTLELKEEDATRDPSVVGDKAAPTFDSGLLQRSGHNMLFVL